MRLTFRSRERRPDKVVTTPLHIDVHSHVLPGIDKGAKTIRQSVDLIAQLAQLGFRKLIITPHIMWGYYPNSPQQIKERTNLLRSYLADEQIDIEIEVAAEYYLDEHFMKELLSPDQMLTFEKDDGQKYLLFETERIRESKHLFEAIKRIKRKGYIPVLAHPERYVYLQNNRILVHQLITIGVLFQVNTISFAGYYGKEARELADYLSVAQVISFLGSDCHQKAQIEILEKVMQAPCYLQIIKSKSILNNQLKFDSSKLY